MYKTTFAGLLWAFDGSAYFLIDEASMSRIGPTYRNKWSLIAGASQIARQYGYDVRP